MDHNSVNLGMMYSNGEGVTLDEAEAVKWYRMAAEQGDATAQFNLGFMYDQGNGVAQDAAAAVIWYRRAAEQGHADAQLFLGLMSDQGSGVPQGFAEAYTKHTKLDNCHLKSKYPAGFNGPMAHKLTGNWRGGFACYIHTLSVQRPLFKRRRRIPKTSGEKA